MGEVRTWRTMSESSSDGFDSFILAIQPSASAEELTSAGSSVRALFTSVISPARDGHDVVGEGMLARDHQGPRYSLAWRAHP